MSRTIAPQLLSIFVIAMVVVACSDDTTTTTTPDAPAGGGTPDAPAAPDSATIDDAFDAYEALWGTTDEGRRRELLELSVTENVYYFDPNVGEAVGWEGVLGVVIDFQMTFPGGTVEYTSRIDRHHDRARYEWIVLDGAGNVVVDGIDHVQLADDGRLRRVQSFFGPAPLPGGEIEPVVQAFVDAMNQPDAAARAGLLATAVSDDVLVFLDPDDEPVVGRDALATAIGAEVAANPGGSFALTSGLEIYAMNGRLDWESRDAGGNQRVIGQMFLTLAGDGRIGEIVTFEDALGE